MPKSRAFIYAVGVALVVSVGAITGAVLKLDGEKRSEQAKPQPNYQANEADYGKAIQALETRRGHLVGQKVHLERKLSDLKVSLARQRDIEQRLVDQHKEEEMMSPVRDTKQEGIQR